MHDHATRQLILGSGLFDPQFYRETYGHLFDASVDPLEHFLAVGLDQGHRPSAAFDPALYRVMVPACGGANPLLHCITSGNSFSPAPLADMFPATANAIPKVKVSPDLKLVPNRAYAPKAMEARQLDFVAAGQRYSLRVPGPEFLAERMRLERPFAYARLPHGFWDCLWQLETAEQALAGDERMRALTPGQRKALATQVCDARYPASGGFAPLFLDDVLAEVPAHAANPDFLRAVSFIGYPTFREGAGIGDSPRGRALARLVSTHFSPDEPLYDGMYWKRMLISGHLKVLPELCRPRPVVLVASEFFSDLQNRWNLERFEHVRIPPARSQWLRRELLDRMRSAVAAASSGGPAPVVLTQCGGSLAFWLISRLYPEFPRVFYIDLGQALDGWFFDVAEIRVYRWMKVYTRSVIENCGLEPFYRRLKGADYDDWFRNLP